MDADDVDAEIEARLRGAVLNGRSWLVACEDVFASWVSTSATYDGPPVWRIYAVAATLTQSASERERCLAEANFMRGRADMKDAMQKKAAKKRTADARAAGSAKPRKFSDDELREALARDVASGKPEQGRRKRLARHFKCADETIGRRLKALNLET